MIGDRFSLSFYNYKVLNSQVQNQKGRVDLVNYQISTGKMAPTFTDQPMASTYVSLKGQIAQQTQFLENGRIAGIRLKIIDQALSGMETVTSEARKAADVTKYSAGDHAYVSTFARNSYDQMIDFLNTQDDQGYVFSGIGRETLPVRVDVRAGDAGWTKLPANMNETDLAAAPPTPVRDVWGSQARALMDRIDAAEGATGATKESVIAALPPNTPPDIVAAARAATPPTPAGTKAAIETAIDANVRTPVDDTPVGSDLPARYFSVWEDGSTNPPTYNWITGAGDSNPRPEYRDFYYTGGPGFDPITGAMVEGLEIQLDVNTTVPMGYSAEENAFEKILRGLNMLAQIPAPLDPENPTEEEKAAFEFYANTAATLLRQGGDELDNIRLRAATASTLVKGKTDLLTSVRNITQDAVDPLENVDKAEAIAVLQALETGLSASYNVISRLQNLNLLSYL